MKNTWLVRPSPHDINRINEFRSREIVAIGWPHIGSLAGKSREELKTILSGIPYNLKGLELGNAYATIEIFINQMCPGDLVLVPNGDDIYFAEIKSDYYFEPSVDNNADGYPHQRKVKWLSDTSRKSLSKELRSSLKVHRTTAKLSHHEGEIVALAAGQLYSPELPPLKDEIDVSYPLRSDYLVEFKIPTDITKSESERLSIYFQSLYFEK